MFRFAACVLLIAAIADAQHPETLSLLGDPLYPPPLPKAERRSAEAAYADAHAAYEKQPNDPPSIIAFARAAAALGRIGDALEILTHGLEAKPDDPAMLAERGRDYIVIRKFAVAERELRKALAAVPAARCSLAFAMYLQGQFVAARDTYRGCAEPGIFASLAERRAAAGPAVKSTTPAPAPAPPIRFPGAAPSPKPKEPPQPIESRYADAIDRLLAGDEESARARLRSVVEKYRKSEWMTAVYIAAEADYARLYKPPPKKKK